MMTESLGAAGALEAVQGENHNYEDKPLVDSDGNRIRCGASDGLRRLDG